LKILNELDYDKISSNFQLLDNKDIPKIDVFVNIDEESNKIWQEYTQLQDIKNSFERKNNFLKIKSSFYNYIVSINNKDLGRTDQINNDRDYRYFIDNYDVENKYNIETGFIYEKYEEPFIL